MKSFWSFLSLLMTAIPLYAVEQTLSIIKPNAVEEHHIGDILSTFEGNGLHIGGVKMMQLTEKQASDFYIEHQNRPFFQDLIRFMTSGPVIVLVLEGDNAVVRNREIMGATDPRKADPGTLRAAFGKDITANAVHGSDSVENAKKEIGFFFREKEIFKKPIGH